MPVSKERTVFSYRSPPTRPPATEPAYCECCVPPLMLKNCVYSYVFLWTTNLGSFWLYLTGFEKDDMLSGYMWDIDKWRYIQLWSDQVENYY